MELFRIEFAEPQKILINDSIAKIATRSLYVNLLSLTIRSYIRI